MSAQLFVVATPIGHLDDMTYRAIDVLKSVKIIAAEDTRTSAQLLKHFNIQTPLTACHDHNESNKIDILIQRLLKGEDMALISDAGTPLISDPGFKLVRAAQEHNIRVIPVPGACAAIAALSSVAYQVIVSALKVFCLLNKPNDWQVWKNSKTKRKP